MPLPIVADVIKVDMQYIQETQDTENVFYVAMNTPVTETGMDGIAAVFESWWADDFSLHVASGTALVNLHLTDLTLATGISKDYPLTPPVNASGGAPLPNNVTFSIEKLIPERYRGGHGRIYIPGIPGAAVTGSYMNAASANEFVADLDALLLSLAAVSPSADLVVLRTTGLGATPAAPRPVVVSGFRYVDLNLDSQRRRLPGRGR